MNLIILAALVAATIADKLDRTYLPPPSAKTAGGSPESLQTPFASNSLNGGLGSLPKGSYTNEFQGVVVDAVAPGIRASGPEETGFGAPRISYGSTNSKVGAAAFKTNPSAFGQASEAESQSIGSIEQGYPNQASGSATPERTRAALDRDANTIQFNSEVGPENYRYSFETDNGIVAEENGVATNGVQAQGGFSYTGDDGQVYTVTYTADEGGYQPKGDHLPTPPPIPEEILKSIEQNAKDEAAGLVDDGSYDALKYNTGGDYADNGDTNGKYSHQSSKYGGAGETDVTASGSFISQNKQSGRPDHSSQTASAQTFQSGNEVEHSQGHSINKQGNAGFFGQIGSSQSEEGFENYKNEEHFDSVGHSGVKQTNSRGNNGFSGHFGSSSFGNGGSAVGSSQNPDVRPENSAISGQTGVHAFAQTHQGIGSPNENSGFPSQGQTISNSNRFEQTSHFTSNSNQASRFGNRNEYLPPMNRFSQNKSANKLQSASQLDQTSDEQTETDQSFPIQTSGNQPQGSNSAPSSREKLISNEFTGKFGSQRINQGTNQYQLNNAGPLSNSASFGQSQRFGNSFSSKSEYLPPSNNFGMNNLPVKKQPQSNNKFNQQYNANTLFSANFPSQNQQQESFSNSPSSSVPTQQPSFGFNSQIKPQNIRQPNYQNNNRIPSSQSSVQSQLTASLPGIQSGSQLTKLGQFQNQFYTQKATSQPDIELTTPLESSGSQNNADVFPTASFNTHPSQPIFRPTASASTASFPAFGSQPTPQPQKSDSRPFGRKPSQPVISPGQPSSNQYQQSQTNSQLGLTSSLSQNNDVQGAPSTPSPTFAQQSQGPDDSYYYREPSKPFGPAQGSRFPSAPSNQFSGGQKLPQNNQFVTQQQSNFPSQNNQFQGSSKYPMPPSIAPTVSSQSQFQSSSFSAQYNGITQASISPFSSQAPTQPTKFSEQGQFGRPNNQPMKPFSQTPSRPSFGQTSMTQASFSQTTVTPFIQKPNRQQPTFQSQPSLTSQAEPTDSASEETPSQQYNGELYEYNKPPEVLPAPENNEPSGSAMLGQNEQNGARTPRPLAGQRNDQFGQRQSSRLFDASPRPQFGQKIQQSTFGSQSMPETSSQPQFGQDFASSSTQDQLNGQNSPAESQSFGSEVQKPHISCCQGSQQTGSLTSSLRPLQGFGSQAQSQFGQSSFPGSQGLRPEASVSSFAGKGEQFGGPRKPPSFDEKTGYHY